MGAACTGNDTKGHFGETDLGCRRDDPCSAAQRNLGPSAKGHAIDGSDPGHRAGLYRGDDVWQLGLLRCAVKFPRICASRKSAPVACQNHTGQTGLFRPPDRVQQTLTHGLANGVHGRVGQRDDADLPLLFFRHRHALPLTATIAKRPE